MSRATSAPLTNGLLPSPPPPVQMLGALSSAAGDTLPNVSDLIQHRMTRRTNDVEFGDDSEAPASASSAGDRDQYGVQSPAVAASRGLIGGGGSGQHGALVDRRNSLFSLGQGAGARRLAEVHVRASIQLLLVQACSEVYTQHSRTMPPPAAVLLLDVLKGMASHSAAVDADVGLRHSLLLAQAADKVRRQARGGLRAGAGVQRQGLAEAAWACQLAPQPLGCSPHWHLPPLCPSRRLTLQVPPERALADPPLLRLEAEASQAYLSVLLHVQAAAPERVKAACAIEARLTQLCLRNLERFEQQEELAAEEAAGGAAAAAGRLALSAQMTTSLLHRSLAALPLCH